LKKLSGFLSFVLILAFVAYYRYDIATFLVENLILQRESVEFQTNEYSKRTSYDYFKIVDDFVVDSQMDIINTIYTILDSGMDEYSFYCDSDYELCQYDVEKISTDSKALSILNNFVHPYNSYNKLYISSNSMGKIKITIDKLYNEAEIKYINEQIALINGTVTNENMTAVEKIKSFHDYVINNTTYDSERANEIKQNIYSENKFMTHKANGVLINKIALCSGYTDLMAVYLNNLNIKNYKISTNEHIWNAVNINNTWLHLDLTWDDPVTDNGQPMLLTEFFLISHSKLMDAKTGQHNFEERIYTEIAITS
jgi:hypothetical protein